MLGRWIVSFKNDRSPLPLFSMVARTSSDCTYSRCLGFTHKRFRTTARLTDLTTHSVRFGLGVSHWSHWPDCYRIRQFFFQGSALLVFTSGLCIPISAKSKNTPIAPCRPGSCHFTSLEATIGFRSLSWAKQDMSFADYWSSTNSFKRNRHLAHIWKGCQCIYIA